MKELLKNKKSLAGIVILGMLVLTALLSPLIAPNDPYEQRIENRLEGPSLEHPLGTDYLGRCLLSRIMYGTRLSLKIALFIVASQVFTGVALGALAGYFTGIVDELIMRIVDMLMAIPSLALALVLASIMGPGLTGVVMAMCISGWTEYARIIRGETLAIKEKEYIKGARMFGFSNFYIITRHVIPNAMAPVIVLATLSTGFVIVVVAVFSFLGLGAQPPVPDWGAMLNESRAYMRVAPHMVIYPGLAVMVTTLAFNLLGDAFRDIFDPRMKTDLPAYAASEKL